jgi:hypothetical protein
MPMRLNSDTNTGLITAHGREGQGWRLSPAETRVGLTKTSAGSSADGCGALGWAWVAPNPSFSPRPTSL